MKQTAKQFRLRKAVVLVAACAMVIGSASIAYAADVGGIQRTVQLWLRGEQTAVTIEFDGAGGYNMEYTDEEGNVRYGGGVGVAIEAEGTERPLSEEELLGTLSGPDVEYRDDGSVWVYWMGQVVEITDRFEDGVCYVQLVNGEDTMYVTVRYQDGYTSSPHKYIDAR